MGEKGRKKPGRFRKAKGTYFFYIFIFFFIGGYALFFSSRGWMSTQSLAKKQTELHKEVEWENRKVRIIRWEYSEEQHLMEVELDITNTKYDGIDTYQYSAMETNAGFLKVKPVIEESDWVIVQIHNIPEKWAEVSFRLELPGEAGEASEKLKLYTNINKVTKVNSLEILDRKGYLVKRYDGEIASYEMEIAEMESEIEEKEEKIRNVKLEMKKLEEKKEYQTEEEQENTDQLLSDASVQQTSSEEDIVELKEKIEERKERIENIQEQIEKVKGETDG